MDYVYHVLTQTRPISKCSDLLPASGCANRYCPEANQLKATIPAVQSVPIDFEIEAVVRCPQQHAGAV
jgi:hypothetical protein